MTGPSPPIVVFVSSTLGECKPERNAARTAIESINFQPVLFEDLGARPYPPRAVYLEGLYRSQICVIIWKENYGYIDSDAGMKISGLEDEFLQAKLMERDIFLYVHKDETKRDARLATLIEDAKKKYTLYFYDDVNALQEQIRDDITSHVSQVYMQRFSPLVGRINDPASVLSGILPFSQVAISRPTLEAALDKISSNNQISWLLGPAGYGKTVLLAQWARKHNLPYINARGLSPIQLLNRIISSLSTDESYESTTSLDQAVTILHNLWTKNTFWPLVIDDPAEVDQITEKIVELNGNNQNARVVIGTRKASVSNNQSVIVPPLNQQEISEITASFPADAQTLIKAETKGAKNVFPLALRMAAATTVGAPGQIFEDVTGGHLDAKDRELLAFLVASPEPLNMDDILDLSSETNAVEIDERLSKINTLIVDDGLGYRPVHDEIAAELKKALSKRSGLYKFVCLQLAQRFATTKRYRAAFEMYVPFNQGKALISAQRAAGQLAVEGALAQSIPALEFIATYYRENGERFGLTFNLLALAQANQIVGNFSEANTNLLEAQQVATATTDEILIQSVQDQILVHRLQRDLKPADLQELQKIRTRYKAENRLSDAGRLAIEEGAILIHINDYENAIPVLRDAYSIFTEIKDSYGVYIAIRNLISALNMSPEGQAEADKLLNELNQSQAGSHGLRERAWMCNILARRYRIDGMIDEAIAVAQEAISIGEKLGDKYLISLNRIALGNALRKKPDLQGALDSFKQSSRESQAINYKETEALASRLAADVLVQMAHKAAPYQSLKLFGEAENFAMYAVGLLRDSIARIHWAEALDTHGDALSGLGRETEANQAYALAARLFLDTDPHRAISIIRDLTLDANKNTPVESLKLLASAVSEEGENLDEDGFSLLIKFIQLIVTHAPRRAIGNMFAAAIRITRSAINEDQEFGLWLRILHLGLDDLNLPKDGRTAFIFSAFLAQLRKRELSITQLNALADLVMSKDSELIIRATTDGHLQTNIKLGVDKKLLVTITDIDISPATRFVGFAITSFLLGFREDINRDFLDAPIADGTHIHINLLDAEQVPEDMKELVKNVSEHTVSVLALKGEDGQRSLYVICHADAQQKCAGNAFQATQLQFMYADIFRALLYATFGDQIEEDVLHVDTGLKLTTHYG